MKAKFVLWVLGLSLFGAAPAFATGISLNFGSPTTIIGDTATYTFGSHTVTATGYQCTDNTLGSCSTTGVMLATKSGSGETGLGILGTDGDHEIQSNSFIQLDFSQLASMGFTSLTFQIQSVQTGEGFRLFESSTAGTPGTTPVLTVTGNGSNYPGSTVTSTVTVNFAQNQFIDISALANNTGNDVLLSSASGTTGGATPEPGTLALFGTGLLGLGCMVRKYAVHSA